MRFTEFPFEENLQKGIEKAGFSECTKVQEETFAWILAGKDVAVQSQTGTGKTAAFLISIFHLFATNRERYGRALVLAPTRELAVQIEEEARLLGASLPFTTGCFHGGVGYGLQEQLLSRKVDVVIGTPGRLLDFVGSGKLSLRDIGIVVIDEADRMFDMGFLPDLRRILSGLKPAEKRRTMLFSATLSCKVKELAWEYMNDPAEIVISPERITVEEITQELYHVSKREKFSLLLGILEREKPESVLIFTNTKRRAEEVSRRLEFNGYPSTFIIGDLQQKKRLAIINGMKQGEVKYLVATDVAARGLHISDLPLVINYDIPEDYENYVHRIGRTARAGKSGKAISIACEEFVYGLPAIEEFIGMKIPVFWPDDSILVQDKSRGVPVTREQRQSRRVTGRGKGRPGSRQRGDHRDGDRETINSNRRGTGREAVTEGGRNSDRGRPEGKGGTDSASRRPNLAGASVGRPESPGSKQRSSSSTGGPTSARGAVKGSAQAEGGKKTGKSGTIEDRLEYYRRKYGENFTLAGKTTVSEKPELQARAGKAKTGMPVEGKLSLKDRIKRFLFGGSS